MRNKRILDDILQRNKAQPVGQGYIDIIVKREYVENFVKEILSAGFYIKAANLWEYCKTIDTKSQLGMSGPRSKFFDGWFAEVANNGSHFVEFKRGEQSYRQIIKRAGTKKLYGNITYKNTETLTLSFDIDVPENWSNNDTNIEIENHKDIRFWDHSFCDIRYYTVNNFTNDVDVINEFIKSKYYKMTFTCPYEDEKYLWGVHGCFLIDKMSSKNYIPVDDDFLRNIIAMIEEKDEHNAPDKNSVKLYNEIIDKIFSNQHSVYYLNLSENDTDYLDESYWILAYFYDFIILDKKNKELINISFGLD
jgi:hypothetical protein